MYDLQIIWFLLIGVLLVGYAILDGFDLGAGVLHLWIAKNDRERRVVMNSIGPVWDGNEVWLLTGGGAIFAAFPKVYATVFSGFYLALMLVLTCLILRAVSLEFRSKEASPRWRTGWDTAFAVGSIGPALLFGVAVGNVLRGVPITAEGEFAGSFWGLLNPFALAVGVLGLAMFVMQGSAWLMMKTSDEVRVRATAAAKFSWIAFVVLWAAVTAFSALAAPHLWKNYTHAISWIVPVVFVIATAAFPFFVRSGAAGRAFTASSISVAALIGIMGQALFPNMVPAFGNPSNSLTIANASSTLLTLRTMLVIALIGMPFVVGYTIWIYRHFMTKVVIDQHSY